MKKNNLLIVIILGIFFFNFISAIPQTISVQGKLTNSSNSALSGTYNMLFKIYNVSTGGSALYSTSQPVNTDTNGIYNAILNNINLTFTEQYFLGIQVESDAEMSPRINLTSSPYAFRANITDYLDSSRNYEMQNLTTLNVNVTYNITANTGFFSWLGSLVTRITSLFVQNIDFTGNINGSGNITTTGNVGIGMTTSTDVLSVNLTGSDLLKRIIFYLNNSQNFSILNNGAAGSVRLEASRTIVLQSGLGSVTFTNNSQSANSLISASSDTNSYLNALGGNVGIGTTSPGSKLEVFGNSYFNGSGVGAGNSPATFAGNNANAVGVQLVNNAAGGGTWSLNQLASGVLTNGFGIYGNSGWRMSIASTGGVAFGSYANTDPGANNMIISGNVGIGTTSPTNNLTVIGTTNTTNLIVSTLTSANCDVKSYTNGTIYCGTDLSASGSGGWNRTTGNTFLQYPADLVGIGTASPGQQLYVYAPTGASQVRVQSVDNYAVSYVQGNVSGVATMWGIFSGYPAAGDFAIRESGVQTSMVIKNTSGNVGIGTTTPQDKLEIDGTNARLVANTLYGGGWLFNDTRDVDRDWAIQVSETQYQGTGIAGTFNFVNVGNGSVMTLTSGNNVGIRTTNPPTPLTVMADVSGNGVRVNYSTGASTDIQSGANAGWFGTINNYPLKIFVNSSTAMTIQNGTGNVGIGTTSPVGALNINTGTGITTTIALMENGEVAFSNQGSATLLPSLLGKSNDNSGLQISSGTNDGNTNGDMLFGVRENDNTDFATTTNIPAFKFRRFATDLVTIQRDGKVGIGTASPAYLLEVTNSATALNISGLLYANSSGIGIGRLPTTSLLDVSQMSSSTTTNKPMRVRVNGTTSPTAGGLAGISLENYDNSSSAVHGIMFISADNEGVGRHGAAIVMGKEDSWISGVSYPGYLSFWTRTNSTGNEDEKMRITSAGSVGIGTTSPSNTLDVRGSGNFSGTIYINNKTDLSNVLTNPFTGNLSIIGGGLNISTGNFLLQRGDAHAVLRVQATGASYLPLIGMVRSRGTLGGITAVQSSDVLGVLRGSGYFNSTDTNYAQMAFFASEDWNSTNNGNYISFTTIPNGTISQIEAMRIMGNGNVGIGTTSPADRLHINGTANTALFVSANGTTSYFQSTINASLYSSTRIGNLNSGGGDIAFFPKDTFAMIIQNTSGNVGIGTTSPGTRLTLAEGSAISIATPDDNSSLCLAGTDACNSILGATITLRGISSSTTPGNLRLYAGGSVGNISFYTNTGTEYMRITSAGNVGIGITNPQSTLQVSGRETLDNSGFLGLMGNWIYDGNDKWLDSGYGGRLDYNNKSNVWAFRTTNVAAAVPGVVMTTDNITAIMVLNGTSGNVGIGTTAPASKLDIADTSANDTIPLQIRSGSSANDNQKNVTLRLVGTATSFASIGDIISGHETNGASRASYLAFATRESGGSVTEKLRITSGGNVGIGTTTPSNILDVRGTGNFSGTIYINNNTNIANYIGSNPVFASVNTSRLNVSNFLFVNGSNVGIGTTSPAQLLTLNSSAPYILMQKNGTNNVGLGWTGSSNDGGLVLYNGTGSINTFIRGSGTDNSYMNVLGGNVGIGTTSPLIKLDVYDNQAKTTFTGDQRQGLIITGSATENSHTFLNFRDTAHTNTMAGIAAQFTAGGSVMKFGTSNNYGAGITNTAMVIDQSGNVGIGTTSPSTRLQVEGPNWASAITINNTGNGDDNVQLRFIGGTGNKWVIGNMISTGGTGQRFEIYDWPNSTARMAISSAGNIGIGTTSPGELLSVFGNGKTIELRNSATDASARIVRLYTDTAIQLLAFGSNDKFQIGQTLPGTSLVVGGFTPYLTILNSSGTGNVGIGTTSPAALLDVAGSFKFQGFSRNANANSNYILLNRTSSATEDNVFYWQTAGTTQWILGSGISFGGGEKFVLRYNPTTLPVLTADTNGNVGIGTTSPGGKLTILNTSASTAQIILANQQNSGDGHWANQSIIFGYYPDSSADYSAAIVSQSEVYNHYGSNLIFQTHSVSSSASRTDVMTLLYNGNVGIGTSTPSTKLEVIGVVNITGQLWINGVNNTAPDYAFEKSYTPMTIDEMKTYTEQNKHLPNIKSAEEIQQSGLNVLQDRNSMLENIENLWIQTYSLNDRIKLLENGGITIPINISQKDTEDLTNRIMALENKSTSFDTRITLLETEKSLGTATPTNISQKDIEDLTNRIITLENNSTSLLLWRSADDARITLLETANTTLTDRVDKLEQQNTEIKKALCEIKPELELCKV